MRKLSVAVLAFGFLAAWAPGQLTPGNYVVVDSSGNVLEVTPGGAVNTFFTYGSALYGVDFDAQGNLICGTGSGAVIRITPAGKAGTVFSGSPLSSIVGDIEVNSLGNYYVPAWSGNAVIEVTPGGTVVTTYATPGLRNWGMGLDEKAGSLFVTGHHTLLIDLGTGKVTTLLAAGQPVPFPQCGELSPNATLVTGDQTAKSVFEIDALGTVTTLINSAAFGDVGEGVGLDRDHAFILADDQAPGSGKPTLFRLDTMNQLSTVALLPITSDLNGCAAVPVLVTTPLSPDPRPGGTMVIGLHSAGAAFKNYLCASSLSARFGIPLPGSRRFPLDLDNLLVITVRNLLPTVFVNYVGNLGAAGRAILQVKVPNAPALAGVTIHTAGITLDLSAPAGIHLVSNALATTIQR